MRRTLLVLLVAVVVLAFAACESRGAKGGGGEARQPATTSGLPTSGGPLGQGRVAPDSPLGSAKALATLHGDGFDKHNGNVQVDVLAIERATPQAVLVRLRISSDGPRAVSGRLTVHDLERSQVYDNSIDPVSGFFLLDLPRRRLHLPMKREDSSALSPCLCSYLNWNRGAVLEPGTPPVVAWAVYQVPPEVTSVAVDSERLGITALLPITQPNPNAPRIPDEPDAAEIGQAFPVSVGLETRTEGRAQSVTETEREVSIALNTDVLFAFDKADLTPAARAELRRVADRAGSQAKGTVSIVGHTDDVGSNAYNQALSERRAQAVRTALARLLAGKPLRLQAEGKGETQPAVRGSTPRARARNRRVEVSFERVAETAAQQPASTSTTTAPPSAVSQAPKPDQPIGTTQGAGDMAGITAELLEVRRFGEGALLLTARLRNTGNADVDLNAVQGDTAAKSRLGLDYGYFRHTFFYPVLGDTGGTRYYVVTDDTPGTHACVCAALPVLDRLNPDDSLRVFALMTAPVPAAGSLDVHIAGFPQPIRNAPVTG